MKARVRNTSIQQQQPSHVVRYQPLAAPPTTSTSIHGPPPVYFSELAQLLSERNPVPPLQPEDKQHEQAEQLAAHQTLVKFAQTLSESDPVVQLKHRVKQREEAEQLAADQELAKELQEEEEHQALLAEARADLFSSPAGPGPSTPALFSEASPSTFRVSGLPVTWVTLSNRPTITTQMNRRGCAITKIKQRRSDEWGEIPKLTWRWFRNFGLFGGKRSVFPFFFKTTAYFKLIVRLVLGLLFLRSKNVLVGQSGRSRIPLLLLHGWETVPFSSTIWITIFGLRVPIHTLILSELTVTFFSVLLGSNVMISTYIFPQHCASPSTSVLISQLFASP